MTSPIQRGAGAVMLALSLAVATTAATADANLRLGRIPTNAAGQPIVNADGSPRNYGPTELRSRAPAAKTTTASLASQPGTMASWGYADFGLNIGYYGIATARVGDHTELFTSGVSPTTGSTYWYALRWNQGLARFDQTFVSDTQFANAIQTLLVMRTTPEGAQQLVVSTVDGNLRRYDPRTKALISAGAGPCTSYGQQFALAAADLNGDGVDELIAACSGGTLVVEGGPGYAGWSLAGVYGAEIVVGQMDDDPALEIALTGGFVVDSAQRKLQWTRPGGFGDHLAVTDVDRDGRDDLVASESWYWVRAHDVRQQSVKWSIQTQLNIASVHASDLDGDGIKELLVADGQWGSVYVYRTSDQQRLGSITNPLHGLTRLHVWDVDGDGRPEILWGAGGSLGGTCLCVAEWPGGSIRGRQVDMAGPFLGPVVGDLDGDGIPEVVIASREAEGGFASGRLVVFDSRTMAVRAAWTGVANGTQNWVGVQALSLRDIDGDGRLEILVGSDRFRSGLVEAFRFSTDNSLGRIWNNTTLPRDGPVVSVEMADIDGDGRPEVLTGTGSAGGAPEQGYLIYAYDGVTGVEKWRSNLNVGSPIIALSVADFDGDGQQEIAAAVEWRGVYIFSAVTHELKAIIPAPQISSLTRLDAYAIPRLLIGHYDGRASEHAFDGGKSYYEVQSLQLTSGRIDGITVGANRSWWVASGGVLARYAGKTRLAESANYGQGFGRTVESIGFRGGVFSTGGYGLHRVDIAR